MRVVCINDHVRHHKHTGEPYYVKDPFLTKGEIYVVKAMPGSSNDVIGIKTYIGLRYYDSDLFISLADWRQEQLKKIL